ncbi:MAG: ATP-binding protein, partial [Bacteroidota bacterium]
KSIEIRTAIQKGLWAVVGDATQLHQVLMNLCVNALDAMPKGGKLTIKADNVRLDETYARTHLEAKAGPYVMITVSDTGIGMPPGIINRIFEPFFTTKAVGRGTGLGLATVSALVKSHGGFVNVYSEVGRGTEFKVYLAASETAEIREAEEKAEPPKGRGELVLVVDDEASILDITKETLEAYGYRVESASDGTEGVALYAEKKGEIDVVLTDMMMPYLDGSATIRALQKINPEVKIIAMSGLAANGREKEVPGAKSFLGKPYTAEKLLKALQEILTSK